MSSAGARLAISLPIRAMPTYSSVQPGLETL
jgi:hypothetical protein